MSHVWRWTSSAPQPCHDVAGFCIDTDVLEAEARSRQEVLMWWRTPGPGVRPDWGTLRQPAKLRGFSALDTDEARHAGPAHDMRASSPPARLSETAIPVWRHTVAQNSLRPGFKLTRNYGISVVQSLVHVQAITSDLTPLQSTIKLFVWAGISWLKPLAQKKDEEVKNRAREMPKVLPPIPGKVWHFMLSSVSGCDILIDYLLLGYFCQSINPLAVTICSIKCHQQIENSIQLNHFNN